MFLPVLFYLDLIGLASHVSNLFHVSLLLKKKIVYEQEILKGFGQKQPTLPTTQRVVGITGTILQKRFIFNNVIGLFQKKSVPPC